MTVPFGANDYHIDKPFNEEREDMLAFRVKREMAVNFRGSSQHATRKVEPIPVRFSQSHRLH